MINSRSELRIVESQSSAVCPRWRRSFNVSSSSKNYRHVKLICNNFSRSTYCQWVTKKTTLVILRRSIRVEHPPPTPPPPGICPWDFNIWRLARSDSRPWAKIAFKCGKGDSWSSLVWSTNNVKLSKVSHALVFVTAVSFFSCKRYSTLWKVYDTKH